VAALAIIPTNDSIAPLKRTQMMQKAIYCLHISLLLFLKIHIGIYNGITYRSSVHYAKTLQVQYIDARATHESNIIGEKNMLFVLPVE
jgi:hypothetical protein